VLLVRGEVRAILGPRESQAGRQSRKTYERGISIERFNPGRTKGGRKGDSDEFSDARRVM